MSKLALNIGCSGMDSQSLSYLLLDKGYRVVTTYRRNTQLSLEKFANQYAQYPNISFEHCDITDQLSVRRLFENTLHKYGHVDEVYLLAAQSHVGKSFETPEMTVLTNGMAPYYFLENIRELTPKSRIYFAACYDDKTKVVTKNGVVPYTNLKVGDKVWSLNPENSHMEEASIVRIFEYDYDGEMIHFKGNGKDFMVTPNHKVFYQGKDKKKLLSGEAKDVNELCGVTLPKADWRQGETLPEVIDLNPFIPKSANQNKQIHSVLSKDLCYLLGLYIGDGSCNIMRNKFNGFTTHEKSNEIRRDPKTGRFNAYGSEYRAKMTPKEGKTARITIDIPPTDKCYARVVETLNRNQIKWQIYNNIDITFFSYGLFHYFDQCGHKSSEKRIPREFLNLKREYLEQILDGLVDSDGSEVDGRRNVVTVSFGLVQDLIELGTKLGLNVYYSKRKAPKGPKFIRGRQIKAIHEAYTVYFNKTAPHLRNGIQTKFYNTDRKTGKYVPYQGKIWCFELDKNHNFLTERNGYVVFCGNTSELFGGDPAKCPFDENSHFECRSPYSIGKELGTRWVDYFKQTYGIYACYGILFNHSCCLRHESFVSRKITKGAANIAAGKQKELKLGNLNFWRDEHWSDFGMEMAWKMLQLDKPETFVICRGECFHGEQFLEEAFSHFNLKWQDYVTIDKSLFRDNEVVKLVGNPRKAIERLGWRPNRMSFHDHISLMCDYDYKLAIGETPTRPDVFKMFPG